MTNPKVQQFYADMRTHWPYACDSVELRVENSTHYVASLILIFATPATPGRLSGIGMEAAADTQDKAEDQAIKEMWKYLWRLTTGFPLCGEDSCKVCKWVLELPTTS